MDNMHYLDWETCNLLQWVLTLVKRIALYSAQIVPSNILNEASQRGHADTGDPFITKQTTEQTPEAG